MTRHLPAHEQSTDTTLEEGIEPGRATPAEWLSLFANAARRRRLVFLGVFSISIAAAFTYYALRTRIYRAETKILAQRHQAFAPVLRTAVPDDVPTRSAAEFILRRDNLIALLRQTNLLSDAPPKPDPSRWDRLLAMLGISHVADDEDPRNLLVLRLDRSLSVVTGDGTVTITLDWPDPQQAYQLVEAALQNFLEARQMQEIKPIDDAIALLKGRLGPLRAKLDDAVDAAQREAGATQEHVTVPLAPTPQATAPRGSSSETVGRLEAAIEARQRSILDIEDFRRKRLLELQSQLEERRTVYSDAHPLVVNLRTEIAGMGGKSPQVEALRAEEAKLRTELDARLAETGRSREAPAGRRTVRASRPTLPASVDQDERVREARAQLQQMLNRINTAQLDLDNARAAFKYRYSVIWPAEVPRQPFSPNPWKVFGAGFVGAILLAFAAAAAPDLVRGRIVERWQVERQLDLPVLATLDDK